MKPYPLIITGIASFILFLFISLPVAHGYSWWGERLIPLKLYEPQGNLFVGSAAMAEFKRVRIENISWEPDVDGLWRANLGYLFKYSGQQGAGKLHVGITPGLSIYFSQSNFWLPADNFARIFHLTDWHPKGRVNLELDSLLLRDWRATTATGVITWNQASIGDNPTLNLGDLLLTISTDEIGIHIDIKGQGYLTTAGKITINTDDSFTLKLNLTPTEGLKPYEQRYLRQFSQPSPDGAYVVDIDGVLLKSPEE